MSARPVYGGPRCALLSSSLWSQWGWPSEWHSSATWPPTVMRSRSPAGRRATSVTTSSWASDRVQQRISMDEHPQFGNMLRSAGLGWPRPVDLPSSRAGKRRRPGSGGAVSRHVAAMRSHSWQSRLGWAGAIGSVGCDGCGGVSSTPDLKVASCRHAWQISDISPIESAYRTGRSCGCRHDDGRRLGSWGRNDWSAGRFLCGCYTFPRRDSNSQQTGSEPAASANWATREWV